MAKDNGGSPKGSFLGGSSISAEDFNSALRSDASAAYSKGPTQTSYVGMGQGTKDAVNNLIASTNNGNRGILDQAYNFNSGLLKANGLNPSQTQAMDYTRGVMQGGGADPAFERLKQNAIDSTRTAINRQFGASGRFGSGGQMIDLGRGLADASAQMDYQNLQRRDAAANQLFNMGQTGTVNAFGAADRSGDMYNNMLLPFQTQIQAQSLLDADRQAAAAFDPNYQHLAKYQSLLSGNSQNPQPAKQPGVMDYVGLAGGLLSAFL